MFMQTDKDQINLLLDVIPDHPNMRIMHFVDEVTILSEQLSMLCHDREYEYLLLCKDHNSLSPLLEAHHSTGAKVKHIDLSKPRYHTQAKMYDYVFVESDIVEIEHFLQTIYKAMKNSADIFILSRQDPILKEQWRQKLEENYFVAFSAFELTPHTCIISAKKMHGWGG